MSNTVVGSIYDHIIKEVIESSRVDFEEGGVDESVLEELREGWQKKLTQLKVAEFPWDPKPEAVAVGAAAVPGPSDAAPVYAQQQVSPQPGPLPLPMSHGVLNGQQGAGDVVPKLEPGIKQEPDLNPVMMTGPYTDSGSVAAARATQALHKNFGNRATSSINAIQAGMTAQNPGVQARPGMNGHMPMPQQPYQQQPHQQHPHQQQPHQQAPGQQHPHNPLPMPQMPQTDGAAEAEAEGVLMQRDGAGNLVEMGRIDIDRMLHNKIMSNAKSMEGGGFMVPLKEATRYPNASALRKNRKAAAPGQVDGGDERVENPEDAINSDLDDTDDGGDESEHDEEGLSHIMLCMYDKVQRVKNKWKCTLKDGVLTVNGKEYVFHKATDFDYVGGPRNYKWINTMQQTKTWEQMHLAYERGIRQIWIVNVGDLKPMELPISHFMSMAYDMSKFQDPRDTERFTVEWAAKQWGAEVAQATSDIMQAYGMLCARRKYEDLSITPFAFHAVNYDEAERNYREWEELLVLAQETHDTLPEEDQVSFFEIVLHPVMAGKTVFEIYSKAAIGAHYAREHSYRADEMAQEARAAFEEDKAITARYHGLLGGKWNRMLDQTHIGYDNWQEPAQNSLPPLPSVGGGGGGGGKLLGIGIQGSENPSTDAATLTLLPMNQYMPPAEDRYIDVFMRQKGSLSYTITSNVTYLEITNPTGSITTDAAPSRARSVITVDWAQVPDGASAAELTVAVTSPANSPGATIIVPLRKMEDPPADFKGHVESEGAVSIEASHFSRIDYGADNATYATIPSYGRTLAGVKLWPVTTASQEPPMGPALIFPFYTYRQAANAKVTVYLSASENADSEHANRYAVAVDGGSPTVVQPVPWAADPGQEPPGWETAVTRNAWIKDSTLGALAPGVHELKVHLLEPTMVLTKIVIDLGGVKPSELGPPESIRVVAA